MNRNWSRSVVGEFAGKTLGPAITTMGGCEESQTARAGRWLFGAGLAGLGVIGVIVGDFALQWQPVPDGLPGRMAIAYAAGGALALAGAGLLFNRSIRTAASILAVMLFAWTVLLHLPRALAQPLDVSRWLGVFEIWALASAAFILAVSWRGLASMTGAGSRAAALDRIALAGFGVSPLVFGLAHFVYADFTASMVPSWIPGRLFWAYFTGTAHIAAGAAILLNVKARLAATMLGAMFASWVLILHAPRVAADPTNRVEWTMIAIAAALTGAAWIVAGRLARRTSAED